MSDTTDEESALRTEVAVLLKSADFAPTDLQLEEILEAWPHVKKMLKRLNRDFGFGDEAAHVFDPLRFGTCAEPEQR